MLRLICYFLFLPLVLCSCSKTKADLIAPLPDQHFESPLALPDKTLYVVSERPFLMSIIDLDSWQILRQVPLPSSYVRQSFARNSDGSLWIGYTGDGFSDDRVQIFQPDGNLKRTFYPCLNPGSGIYLFVEQAVIICDELGFYGTVLTVDTNAIQVTSSYSLTLPMNEYLVHRSGGDSENLFVFGMTSGPIMKCNYIGTSVLDARTSKLKGKIPVLPCTSLSDVVIYQGDYYLLNSASWQTNDDLPNDDVYLVHRDALTTTIPITIAHPAPTWGVVIGDDLYTYHDPSWNQANSKPERAIARTSLKTGEGKVWNLPDYFWAGDMIVADGKILLAETDGVFEFDPETGEVTRRVKIDYARLMATKE